MIKSPTNADCAELNRRYGAPGRIVFRPSPSGAPVAALVNQYGAAELSLYGGHTLGYRPTGNLPVLFMSKFADFRPGNSIHGGIPVCWPWFGRNGEPGTAPHGFARLFTFSVRASEYSEEITQITLGLASSDETKKLWPYEFDLELKFSISMKLNLSLTTTNTGKVPFKITEGFHPYFRVRNRADVTIRGLAGCEVVDARDMSGHTQVGDFAATEASDHVFTVQKHEWALLDPGLHRAIALVSRGNSKLVVWNPGPTKPGEIPNLAPDEYQDFLCVEPATLFRDAAIEVKPGEKHELLAAIQSVPDDGSVHARHA